MMDPTPHYAYYPSRFMSSSPLLHHFICPPLHDITDMNTMSILARNPMVVNFLPLVHLVGSVPQHCLIAQFQCSLTNSTRCRMDHQMVPSRPLHGRPSAIARYPQ